MAAFIIADKTLDNIIENKDYERLRSAVELGRLKEVKAILQNHPDFARSPDDEGNLPLHWAAKSQHISVFKHLLSKYPESAVIVNHNNETPVYTAIMNDSFKSVMKDIKLLLKDKISLCEGQRISSQGEVKQTHAKSLVHAILSKNRDKWIAEVGVLFEHDKKLMASLDDRGLSPLSSMIHNTADERAAGMAIELAKAYPKLIKVHDMDNSDRFFPIHRALMDGKFEVIEVFYEKDTTSIDLKDRHKRNIFDLAANYYKPEFLNLFKTLGLLEEFKKVLYKT